MGWIGYDGISSDITDVVFAHSWSPDWLVSEESYAHDYA